jgi:glycosyltransferase involved in cell wall biosynthesis
MRIGISTSVIQRGKTGVAQYLFGLLRAFLPIAHEHRFTLFVLEEDLPLFGFLEGSMDLVPVAEKVRPPIRNILWHQAVLPKLVRRHALDVMHIPSYRRLLWAKPCPQVATIHDLAPFRVPHKYDRKRMLYGRVIAKRLARRQDAVIAVSENTARDLETFFGLPKQRVRVIHNGLDHQRFFPGDHMEAKVEVARRHGLQRPFFLYVARLEHPGKNHIRLISAFEEFKAATSSNWLLAFGGSDWAGSEAIHNAIRSSPCAADIRCLGFVPDSDLPVLYRAADSFVYPSLYEGFGMPPLEAMTCACPVICSARGSLGEVVGNAARIIEPEDIHSIARELYIVATDESVRNGLRAAGLAQASKFDWKRTASQTLQVYEEARGRRS